MCYMTDPKCVMGAVQMIKVNLFSFPSTFERHFRTNKSFSKKRLKNLSFFPLDVFIV